MSYTRESWRTTGIIVGTIAVGILVYDAIRALTGRPTFSEWGWHFQDEFPILVFCVGVLFGHIWTRKISQVFAWCALAAVVFFEAALLYGLIGPMFD